MTQNWDTNNDEFIVLDNGTDQKRKLSSEIFGANAFNSTTIPTNNTQLLNGAGYTTNTGTVTGTGTDGTIAQWSSASGIEDSIIVHLGRGCASFRLLFSRSHLSSGGVGPLTKRIMRKIQKTDYEIMIS